MEGIGTAAADARRACGFRLRIAAYAAVALLLFGLKLAVIGHWGNRTPFWDQWDGEGACLYTPDRPLDARALLRPHSEHRILTARLLLLAEWKADALWDPFFQMEVHAAILIATMLLVVHLLSRALDPRLLPALLGAALLLCGLPLGWTTLLWGFEVSMTLTILFSVAALWLFARGEPLGAAWWGGLACAVLAYFSMASGALALAAGAALLAYQAAAGPGRTWRHAAGLVVLGALFVAAVHATPMSPDGAILRARSAIGFLHALAAVLAWPLPSGPFGAAWRNLPVLAFLVHAVAKRRGAPEVRFVGTLALWCLLIAASTAYARCGDPLNGRYYDFRAVAGLLDFGCAAFFLLQRKGWQGRLALAAVAVWMISIAPALRRSTLGEVWTMNCVVQEWKVGEAAVRRYLDTRDPAVLAACPHLPYPIAGKLAALIDRPGLRETLPPNLRPAGEEPPRLGRFGRLVDGLLRASGTVVALGTLGVAAVAALAFRFWRAPGGAGGS